MWRQKSSGNHHHQPHFHYGDDYGDDGNDDGDGDDSDDGKVDDKWRNVVA